MATRQGNWLNNGDMMRQLESAYAQEKLDRDWGAEKSALESALEAIGRTLPSQRYSANGVLGVGGSGVVIRLRDSLFPSVDNALKFPRPVPGKVELIAEMLGKELKFLAEIRHPGIVKMLYYRTVADVEGYTNLPFYVMEAVDGDNTKKYFQREEVTAAKFLDIVLETAHVIHYLHTHPTISFAHLDIKPENIVVTADGRPIMIDLGTCKRLGSDDSKTIVACTRSIAHPELVRRLAEDPTENNRARGAIRRSEIDPVWDLWAFGRTILIWLGVRYEDGQIEKGAFIERLDTYNRKYLLLMCGRLLTDSLPTWLIKRLGLTEPFLKAFPLRSSKAVCAQVERLLGSDNPVASIPEIGEATTGTIQAAAGVHVPNTQRLQMTLGHRLVRRLGGITQLGVVSQIYPSAKHTRREHSLGTYGNVGRVVRALYNDPVSPLFKQIIEEQDIREILLISLLHDIGQFPLAHDLEEVDENIFDHDKLTEAMLKGLWKTGKRGGREIRFESFEQIFSAWGTSRERLLAVLSAKATSNTPHLKDKLLRSIISGPIDADKLDYLFRDARHADVPYPNGIDVDRLFRCLTTVVFTKIDGNVENVPAIGVHAKGKVTAEFMTMARYAMFSQVYWHHAVRAHKAMLFRAVGALLAAHNSDSKLEEFRTRFLEMVCALPESLYVVNLSTPPLFQTDNKELSADTYFGRGTDLVATDASVLTWLRDRLAELKRPESGLIDGILTRDLFKRLWVIGRDNIQEKRWDKLVKLWDHLDRSKRDRAARDFELKISEKLTSGHPKSVTAMSAEDAVTLVDQRTRGQQPWLLIDIPPGGRAGSEVGLSYVMESQARRLRKDDRTVGDLQVSSVWEQYAKELRQVAGKIRIFCDPALVETLDASMSQGDGFDELLGVVERLAV